MRVYTNLDRKEIFNGCFASASIHHGLTAVDIHRFINMFEHSEIEPSKVGNIIKYICVTIEERQKQKNVIE